MANPLLYLLYPVMWVAMYVERFPQYFHIEYALILTPVFSCLLFIIIVLSKKKKEPKKVFLNNSRVFRGIITIFVIWWAITFLGLLYGQAKLNGCIEPHRRPSTADFAPEEWCSNEETAILKIPVISTIVVFYVPMFTYLIINIRNSIVKKFAFLLVLILVGTVFFAPILPGFFKALYSTIMKLCFPFSGDYIKLFPFKFYELPIFPKA